MPSLNYKTGLHGNKLAGKLDNPLRHFGPRKICYYEMDRMRLFDCLFNIFDNFNSFRVERILSSKFANV